MESIRLMHQLNKKHIQKQYTLSINKPCGENWNNFKQTQVGGFCNSCQKEVVDFTTMTELEIKQYFKQNVGTTCGRFNKSQLKTYTESNSSNVSKSYKWFGAASVIGFSLLHPFNNAIAQSKQTDKIEQTVEKDNSEKTTESENSLEGITVSGIVTSIDDGYALPGVNVVVKGKMQGTVTDFNGNYKLSGLRPDDVLVFSFIGLATEEVKLGKGEVSMNRINMGMLSMACDLMGEVAVNEVYSSKKSIWQRFRELF